MTRVTAEYLRRLGAFCGALDTVEKHWPDGVPMTVPSLMKALELGLDVDWFALHVLSTPAYDEYERVRAEAASKCAEVVAEALAKYTKVTVTEGDKVKAAALAECRKVAATARDEYQQVTAAHLAPALRAAIEEEER